MRNQLIQVHSLFRKFDNKVERFSISGHISFCLVFVPMTVLCNEDCKLWIVVTRKSIFHKDWFLYLSCPLYSVGKVRIFEFSSKWISLCVHLFCVFWICCFFPLIQCVFVNSDIECKSFNGWICLSENNMLFWFQSTSSSWIVLVLIIGSIDCNLMWWSRHEVNQHCCKFWSILCRSSEWRNIELHKVFLLIQCINWWFIFNFCDFFDVSLNHMWKYYVIINEIIFRILLLANYEKGFSAASVFLIPERTGWYTLKNTSSGSFTMTLKIHSSFVAGWWNMCAVNSSMKMLIPFLNASFMKWSLQMNWSAMHSWSISIQTTLSIWFKTGENLFSGWIQCLWLYGMYVSWFNSLSEELLTDEPFSWCIFWIRWRNNDVMWIDHCFCVFHRWKNYSVSQKAIASAMIHPMIVHQKNRLTVTTTQMFFFHLCFATRDGKKYQRTKMRNAIACIKWKS